MTSRPAAHAPALLFLPLALLIPAACVSGQAAPVQVATGAPSAPAAPLAPPNQAGDPSIRSEWVEGPGVPVQVVEEGSFLTVSGVAEVQAPPDRVRLYFAVETEGTTAREAGERNAALMTAVSSALRSAGAGLDGFRLETSGYSLSPRYGPPRGNLPQEIVGYTARNTVEVSADEIGGTGPLIDVALGAGANRVSGLRFEVSDPEPFRHAAVREAVRKGRAEAEVMAAALGMRLGPPVDVQGGADMYYPMPIMEVSMRSMDAAQVPPTPIEGGLQSITARVSIRFRLDPAP